MREDTSIRYGISLEDHNSVSIEVRADVEPRRIFITIRDADTAGVELDDSEALALIALLQRALLAIRPRSLPPTNDREELRAIRPEMRGEP